MEKLLEIEKGLEVTTTNIPDLLVIDLPTDGLARKKWHQEKLAAFGPPSLGLVHTSVSFDIKEASQPDTQTESDRYIFVETGHVFVSCIDLRPGETFDRAYMTEINTTKAVFVPRGVGCSFQTLEDVDNTICTYATLDDSARSKLPASA